MSDAPKPKLDPVKLEQLNVATDYPLEPEEFETWEAHDPGAWLGQSNWQQNPYDIRALSLNLPGSG